MEILLNILKMEKYYSKENIKMGKKMEKEKNIKNILNQYNIHYYMKENF